MLCQGGDELEVDSSARMLETAAPRVPLLLQVHLDGLPGLDIHPPERVLRGARAGQSAHQNRLEVLAVLVQGLIQHAIEDLREVFACRW